MTKDIWICIGKAGDNYDAYAPEVPGCIAAGDTIEDTKERMILALSTHLNTMVEDGNDVKTMSEAFPLADALEANENGEEEYYVLVKVTITGAKVGV